MSDADRRYCLLRADQERARVAASDEAFVAERHIALAGLFELRANDPDAWAALSTQVSS